MTQNHAANHFLLIVKLDDLLKEYTPHNKAQNFPNTMIWSK